MNIELSSVEAVEQRYSCRSYDETPLSLEQRLALEDYLAKQSTGPLGTPVRIGLTAATPEDRSTLKGLGTYGVIRGAPAFLVGAVREGPYHLEDFGYQVEDCILFATRLGLNTCWLGGFFTKSRFAEKISARRDEQLPAIVSVGHAPPQENAAAYVARSKFVDDRRLPWESLFFDGGFQQSLLRQNTGEYTEALRLLRLGPSASNKQPWRVIRAGGWWHFYLQRTPIYGTGLMPLLKLADLQRIDIGIAMYHFEIGAKAAGLSGHWEACDPKISLPNNRTSYVISWAS